MAQLSRNHRGRLLGLALFAMASGRADPAALGHRRRLACRRSSNGWIARRNTSMSSASTPTRKTMIS